MGDFLGFSLPTVYAFQKTVRLKARFLWLWNRSTQMPLVRHDAALFQDQLQTPDIGDVLERIGPDHNQVGELARLHRAQFGGDAAHLSAMARGRYQRLPRRRPVATHSPISSSAASLRGPMSEPNAIRTPASGALRNHVACTSEAASARQHSACDSPRCATQAASNGLVAWLAVRWLMARVGTYQTS